MVEILDIDIDMLEGRELPISYFSSHHGKTKSILSKFSEEGYSDDLFLEFAKLEQIHGVIVPKKNKPKTEEQFRVREMLRKDRVNEAKAASRNAGRSRSNITVYRSLDPEIQTAIFRLLIKYRENKPDLLKRWARKQAGPDIKGRLNELNEDHRRWVDWAREIWVRIPPEEKDLGKASNWATVSSIARKLRKEHLIPQSAETIRRVLQVQKTRWKY